VRDQVAVVAPEAGEQRSWLTTSGEVDAGFAGGGVFDATGRLLGVVVGTGPTASTSCGHST
jgi:hypothetical protein